MKVYKVSSGSLKAKVKGETAYAAVKSALKTKRAKFLGAIVAVLEVGRDERETQYVPTEAVLRELGLWGE